MDKVKKAKRPLMSERTIPQENMLSAPYVKEIPDSHIQTKAKRSRLLQ